MKDICIIEKQLKDLDINDRFFDSLKNEYEDFIESLKRRKKMLTN